MKDEYIIINKTAIQKRIGALENIIPKWQGDKYQDVLIVKKDIYKSILSQSTPLIPEIENAMNAAREIQDDSAHDTFTAEDISGCTEVCTYGWRYKITNEDYISNLKFNMENITAKNVLIPYALNDWGPGVDDYDEDNICKAMIEFAKIHVEKALIAASENSIKMSSTKDTVKNAYDLNNIV